MIKITNLKKDGNAVFFTINDTDRSTNYRTNQEGEGLFLDKDFWYAHQIEGTAQFTLKQKTMSGIRKAIHRHFSK